MNQDESVEPVAATVPVPAESETELKFELGSTDLRRLLRHAALSAPARTMRMTSVYYDTADFGLRKAGVSLRVRQTEDGFVQTLKRGRSGDIFNRDEWETPVTSLAFDAEALAGTPAAKILRKVGGELAPVFKAVVDRTIRTWARDTSLIEVVVDKGELRGGLGRQRISELELELKAGDREALYALARELFAISPVRLSLTSKGERGYRLVSATPSGKAATPGLTPEMTVATAFATIMRSCLIQIIDAADAFRKNPAPDCIHQTRIGLRRLRSALKIFKQAVSDDRYAWVNAEVHWLADELGGARNLDVFFEETFRPVAPALLEPKVAARYADQLEKARAAAYRRANAALSSSRFAKLTLELALWIEDGGWRQAPDETRAQRLGSLIGPFATDALDRLRKVVRSQGDDFRALDIDSRHKLRIRAKRLRYATDFFAQAFGDEGDKKKRKEFENALKALQTSLGQLNDIAQANAAAIEALDGSSSSSLTFAAGELVGRLKSQEPKMLARAQAAYGDFAEAKKFWPKPKLAKPVKTAKPAKEPKPAKAAKSPKSEKAAKLPKAPKEPKFKPAVEAAAEDI